MLVEAPINELCKMFFCDDLYALFYGLLVKFQEDEIMNPMISWQSLLRVCLVISFNDLWSWM